MRGATFSGLVALLVAGCMDPKAPETLAGQRLEVGDQRLIAWPVTAVDMSAYGLIGVTCETGEFPVQALEPDRDPAIAGREFAFAAAFNRAMVASPYYSAAECRAFTAEGQPALGRVGPETTQVEAPGPGDSFRQIFGFEAPQTSAGPARRLDENRK